jgi:hypothetical protein
MEIVVQVSVKRGLVNVWRSFVPAWFKEVLYIEIGDLSHGVSYGYVLDDCCYSRDTVVSGIPCLFQPRSPDTFTDCDCRNYSSLSALDWKTYLEWSKEIALTEWIEPLTTRVAEKKKD